MKKRNIFLIVIVALIVSLMYDQQIINFVISLRFSFLNTLMIGLSYVSRWVIFGFVTLLLLKKYLIRLKKLLFWFVSFALCSSIVYFLKVLIERPRPELIALVSKSGFAFPSGHAATVFLALPFFKNNKYWLIFALIVCFSRLYLGVHYLSDVIVGGLIGYIIGALIVKKYCKA